MSSAESVTQGGKRLAQPKAKMQYLFKISDNPKIHQFT